MGNIVFKKIIECIGSNSIKAIKLISTLVGLTLIIIGYYYHEWFTMEQENAIGEKKNPKAKGEDYCGCQCHNVGE